MYLGVLHFMATRGQSMKNPRELKKKFLLIMNQIDLISTFFVSYAKRWKIKKNDIVYSVKSVWPLNIIYIWFDPFLDT